MTCRRQKRVCGGKALARDDMQKEGRVRGCKDVGRKVRGNMPGVSGGKAPVRNDTSPTVIARSEATWQSVLLRQGMTESSALGEYGKVHTNLP